MRIACLFIPHFPVAVERVRRPELRSQPVIIGGAPEERKVVLDCSQEAIQYGVQAGMPLREALSRCKEAAFLDAHPTLYNETAAAINSALGLISPLVEPADLGRVFVGLGGLGKGPDAELLLAHSIAQAAKQVAQLTPKIGIADGKFVAFAAAATGTSHKPHIIKSGAAPGFLAKLPVSHLPVSPEMHRRLRLFGFRTLGQLADLPVGAVQAQFGPEGRVAWELANGIDNTPFIPQDYPVVLAERLSFQAPINNIEALLIAANHLIARIMGRREFQHRATRGLKFKAVLTNGHTWERQLVFREPLSDHSRILFALRGKLDGIALPAAVEEIEVGFLDVCGESGVQGNLLTSLRSRQIKRVEEIIRQLKSRYGSSPIARVVEVEPWSRIPERRMALIDYDP